MFPFASKENQDSQPKEPASLAHAVVNKDLSQYPMSQTRWNMRYITPVRALKLCKHATATAHMAL